MKSKIELIVDSSITGEFVETLNAYFVKYGADKINWHCDRPICQSCNASKTGKQAHKKYGE